MIYSNRILCFLRNLFLVQPVREKMKEYITGRIKLSNCSSAKNIGEVPDAEKKMELTFVLGEDGEIVVDKVPGVYGVRCDSIVEGFIKGGTRSIRPVEFPTSSKCQKERKVQSH